jgi:hypothetical protein
VGKMDENEKKRIVNSVDLIVALFILVLGIIIIIFSLSWDDYISTYSFLNAPTWLNYTTWIFFIIGVTTIAYGIKRMVHDLLP